jgi:hypothetical protein
MPIPSIPLLSLLLETGNKIVEAVLGRRKATKARTVAVAELFDHIADCLKTIATVLRQNHEPSSECQELAEYVNSLPEVLGKSIEKERIKELMDLLWKAEQLPVRLVNPAKLGLAPIRASRKKALTREIDTVAGTFRANANLLRARA